MLRRIIGNNEDLDMVNVATILFINRGDGSKAVRKQDPEAHRGAERNRQHGEEPRAERGDHGAAGEATREIIQSSKAPPATKRPHVK